MNFIITVGSFLKEKSCNVFRSDLRIHIPSDTLFTYQDEIIICSEPQMPDEEADFTHTLSKHCILLFICFVTFNRLIK